MGKVGSVDGVHTLGLGLGRTGAGLAGFRMFPGESNVCGGWNAVRVPPRHGVFPFKGLWGLCMCSNCSPLCPCGGLFLLVAVVVAGGSFS